MLPPLLAYLGRHCLIGIAAGWSLLAGLIATDVGSLWSLLSRSGHWPEALALLVIFFAITFGSLAMGTAVMLLGSQDGDGEQRRRRRSRPALGARPALQTAGVRKRR